MDPAIDDGLSVIRADPRYRRRWMMFYGAMVMGGAMLVYLLPPWLGEWMSVNDARGAMAALRWILPALFLPFAAVAFYNLRLAARVRRAGRYPLAGARVLADTPVRRGRDARRLALRLLLAGWALGAIALAGAVYSYVGIGKLLGP
jgi:cytochrome bd-type quinol oxidase subunit 1